MVQVGWSRRALTDLAGVRAYIELARPLAAQRMAARLKSAAEALGEYPMRGRLAGGKDMRELTVIWPYIIRYRVTKSGVVIIGIRHGAREAD